MAKKRITGRQAAERLLAAVNASDDLTCEEAQDLLPALAEAKFAGAAVEADPQYARLLRHLARDETCRALYARLLEDLEAQIGEQAPLSQPPPATRPEAAAISAREGFALRVVRGLKRRFEIDLAVPDLTAALAAASGYRAGEARRERLLARDLPDVPGDPHVSVALDVRAGPAEMRVVIRERPAQARWQVQLRVGDALYAAKTDERGVATLIDLRVADLQRQGQISLTCVELE